MIKALSSIAILNPLGDYGINAYSFELSEGLASQGVSVDFYTNGASPMSELPAQHRHRSYPVLGSLLFKQRQGLGAALSPRSGTSMAPAQPAGIASPGAAKRSHLRTQVRDKVLLMELLVHLKRKRYDLIWTQWPDVYGAEFWKWCRILGMKTAHTVHNILPHEESPEQIAKLRRVYSKCDVLIVHSEHTEREFSLLFPELANRVLVSHHGTYTVYPRRPEARERLRREWNIRPGQPVAILCGGIRPYKNIDSVLAALADPKCASLTLVVAGEEAGYPESSAQDRLARTRRLAQEFGVLDRVRLIPQFLRAKELAELFEAGDILVLPYIKNYGSGLLLLGMTFGKYIVATDTGGASEYLRLYPRHAILKGTEVPCIADGLRDAADSIGSTPLPPGPTLIDELQWPTIAHNALTMIGSVL